MNSTTITLGRLVALLKKRDPESLLRYDFGGFVPTRIASYRGYYDHLALNFKEPGVVATTTVDVLHMLESANGAKFFGYKGGEYIANWNVPVWVANYGECHDTGIIGLADCDDQTIIATAWCNFWG